MYVFGHGQMQFHVNNICAVGVDYILLLKNGCFELLTSNQYMYKYFAPKYIFVFFIYNVIE